MTHVPLLPQRLARLLSGLFLYGIAISLMVRANLGVAPWDVLTQGVVQLTGLSFGLLINLIGLAVLLLCWPLRQKPGPGTVLNVLLIGWWLGGRVGLGTLAFALLVGPMVGVILAPVRHAAAGARPAGRRGLSPGATIAT